MVPVLTSLEIHLDGVQSHARFLMAAVPYYWTMMPAVPYFERTMTAAALLCERTMTDAVQS
jgi:hypothetical protein